MSLLALTYHDVTHPNNTSSGYAGAGADRFKLTQARFAEYLDATEPVQAQARSLFLTFDDVGASARETIAVMLAERGWRGHFFVVTSLIGEPGFLGPEGVKELHAAGTWSAATVTRIRTSRSCPAHGHRGMEAQQGDARCLLGGPVEAASVPTGFYTATVGRCAVEAGLTHLFTSEPWLEPRPLDGGSAGYGRFSVISTTPAARIASLCRLSRAAVWREASLFWYGRQVAKRALGPLYTRLREPLLARLTRR